MLEDKRVPGYNLEMERLPHFAVLQGDTLAAEPSLTARQASLRAERP